MGEKKRNKTIYLDPKQLKLFKFLKSNSADFSHWPSIEEISDKINLSEDESEKLLSSLRKEEEIIVGSRTVKEGKKKITYYGLSPETFEILVKPTQKKQEPRRTDNVYSALYLAEPGFGTKAFDDEYTMKGLALALEVNGFSKDLQEVIIQGGVIPHLPPYSSKGYDWDLKFLGQVKREEGEKKRVSEKLLEGKIETIFEKEFYEKFINNDEKRKITNLTDAFASAETQVTRLMNSLPKSTVLRIQLGEEDRKNIEHLQAVRIQEWSDEQKEKIKYTRDEITDDATELYKKICPIIVQRDYLINSLRDKKLLRLKGESRTKHVERVKSKRVLEDILEKSRHSFLGVDNSEIVPKKKRNNTEELEEAGVKNAINYLFNSNPGKVKAKIKGLNEQIRKISYNFNNLKLRIDDINESDSWTKQLLGTNRRSITWFTRQYPVFSDAVELIFKQVKDKYTAHFYDWNIAQVPVINVSPRKRTKLELEVVELVDSKKGEKANIEYEIKNTGDKKIMLIHNLRHIFSDAVTPRAIKDAKLMMNYENMILNKFFKKEIETQPDIVLLGGHQAGGFRVMPWFKDSEQLVEGEFIKDQKISYLINLPTLQSVEKLEWLVSKGFKNWHTKRFESGPYASGAIVHTEKNDGVNTFTVFDTILLNKFGKIAEEIEECRERLKDKKLSREQRKEIFGLIRDKKAEVKTDFKKIEAAGDFHLGAPDHPGRYSKDQFIEAAQSYQIRNGLPDIVSWDEICHGCLDFFGSGSRYLGMTPAKFKRKIINQILKSDLSGEEKAVMIAKESLRNHRAITVHNEADQREMFAEMLRPYAERILRKGGKVILESGNHMNNSNKKSDEALDLANQFSTEYRDNKKVIAFSGRGNPVGVGAIRLEGGQTLFVMHKFPERQDEIYGPMTHLRKMNNDADIVIAGDRHQPGAGYADGHFIVLHPGMEPINKYVPLIGKPAGVRGFNNIFYDPGKKGVYSVEFVINPTLEKIVEAEKII